MNNGWIKLHRKLTEWEWYDDIPTKILFLHLLLTVNFEPKKWHGIQIERGEVLIGRKKLAKRLRLSERQVRTALTKLKSTNEVSIKTTNQYSLVKLNNYNDHQLNDQQQVQRPTSDRPASDQQATTTKEREELNKVRRKEPDDALFLKFWNMYPKRISKEKAKTVYLSILRKRPELEAVILAAIDKQKKWRETKNLKDEFVAEWKHPTTWLNQGCWEDELPEEPQSNEELKNKIKTFFQNTGRQPTPEEIKAWQAKVNNGEKI